VKKAWASLIVEKDKLLSNGLSRWFTLAFRLDLFTMRLRPAERRNAERGNIAKIVSRSLGL